MRVALAFLVVFAVAIATATAQDMRLMTAVAEQDAPTVQALLAEGVDVNTPRADGATALLWAAHWDALDTVELLLQTGADVNTADDHGVTPLLGLPGTVQERLRDVPIDSTDQP